MFYKTFESYYNFLKSASIFFRKQKQTYRKNYHKMSYLSASQSQKRLFSSRPKGQKPCNNSVNGIPK